MLRMGGEGAPQARWILKEGIWCLRPLSRWIPDRARALHSRAAPRHSRLDATPAAVHNVPVPSFIDGQAMKDFVLFIRHYFKILRLVGHTLLALLAIMAAGAGVIALAEGMNYWDALYLTFVTGLTIGYGDIVPKTVLGRSVCILIGLLGIVFFGILVAVANRALAHSVEEKLSIVRKDAR
jgi:voltage-gated potassium channel